MSIKGKISSLSANVSDSRPGIPDGYSESEKLKRDRIKVLCERFLRHQNKAKKQISIMQSILEEMQDVEYSAYQDISDNSRTVYDRLDLISLHNDLLESHIAQMK